MSAVVAFFKHFPLPSLYWSMVISVWYSWCCTFPTGPTGRTSRTPWTGILGTYLHSRRILSCRNAMYTMGLDRWSMTPICLLYVRLWDRCLTGTDLHNLMRFWKIKLMKYDQSNQTSTQPNLGWSNLVFAVEVILPNWV